MRTSVIVPVWNEDKILRGFLRRLRDLAPQCEVIVVDGGSDDESFVIATELADRAIQSPRGRAAQMNAGANIASGDVLWFVHADSNLSVNSAAAIETALADSRVIGGCFRLRVESPPWIYRIRDLIGKLLVALTGIALGDRGFFCRRAAFSDYPQIGVLEDAEFYRGLKRNGRVVQLRETIGTSPRRYEALGPITTMSFYAFVMLLYVARVPIPTLERMVRAYMQRRRS